MGKVSGMKEKLHYPIYDAFYVPKDNGNTFGTAMGGDTQRLRFFTDITGKTKLETNLQAAGVLPSMNSMEVRALRIVASYQRDRAGAGSDIAFLDRLIFQSVTSLLVGEKVMIEVPTFWFPSGTGVSSVAAADFGRPDPTATFRFAEPVFIEPQQNFRVEMLFPRPLPTEVKDQAGPLWVWAVLDGYLTRDVQ